MDDRFATYPSLRGKGVVITGGANGIGRAMSLAFAEQGSRVAVVDVDVEAGEQLARELGASHTFVECDVTETPDLREAIDQTAAAFGGLDVLIANAADDTATTPGRSHPSSGTRRCRSTWATSSSPPRRPSRT